MPTTLFVQHPAMPSATAPPENGNKSEQPVKPPSEPPKPPVLPLRMAGVIEDDQGKRAFVEDVTTQRSHLVRVGDTIQEAQILQIEPAKMILQKGEFQIELHLQKEGPRLPPAALQKVLPFERRVVPRARSETGTK